MRSVPTTANSSFDTNFVPHIDKSNRRSNGVLRIPQKFQELGILTVFPAGKDAFVDSGQGLLGISRRTSWTRISDNLLAVKEGLESSPDLQV